MGTTPSLQKVCLILSASILIADARLFIMCWHIIMVGLFGVFFIPFQLLQRNKHRQQQVALRHRELLNVLQHQRLSKD